MNHERELTEQAQHCLRFASLLLLSDNPKPNVPTRFSLFSPWFSLLTVIFKISKCPTFVNFQWPSVLFTIRSPLKGAKFSAPDLTSAIGQITKGVSE